MQTERGLETVAKTELEKDERDVLLEAYDKCDGNCEKCACVALVSGTHVSVCAVLGHYNNMILKQINLLMEKL